ncbi:LacI family DNA-binding transcriptional regulator [Actinoplanes bogorensis]|uniref:LacI family DNA-binding transcriptional regulator n=1 Tax=Paractinoplanes bogorensis TaxID=1610840 RepID=A0ABS5YVG1_9ACTN|nr:LacI family DNA-binding transcriptional regulator [Actinoplanes bogorensis]MBU2667442.1 LacI family DNA-binding transcriptional regulator [Actinoplanes bogorensis]
MKHRVREIAAQAGLSQATVDRVLHERGGVRESTVREVHQAIAALDRQSPGRTWSIDLVVHEPERAEAALRAELPGLRPAVIRPRFHAADDPLAAVARIARSRSHGLVLQAAPSPELAEAVAHLKIPVVALDRGEAGATAAYLVEQWLADRAGDVLIVAAGDNGRTGSFRSELAARAPNRRVLVIEPDGVKQLLADSPSVRAVYDAGSGQTAYVVNAFAEARRNYDVFVAHELDDETIELLRAGRLSAVLHHDLRADLRTACRTIVQPSRAEESSVVQVITPLNMPG